MKKLVFGSFAISALFTGSLMAASWTGFVSDSMCGAKHTGAGAGDAACAQKCIKGGSDPVFVSDGKVLKFDAGSMDQAKAHAGEKVKITGKLAGDTVTISKIATAN